MNVRSLVLVAVVLPSVAVAQRRMGGTGRTGGGRVAPPAALPPTPGTISREQRYIRLPISAESYTFISFSQGPRPAQFGSSWSSLAAATRFDYRMSSKFSLTTDLTQTIFSPTPSGSLELGMRYRPWGSSTSTLASKVRPFVDGRYGYQYTQQSYFYSPDPTAVNPVQLRASQSGRGLGWVAGAGAEFDVTRTMAITTGFWSAQSRLKFGNSAAFQPNADAGQFRTITSSRIALGLKWNPVRAVASDMP